MLVGDATTIAGQAGQIFRNIPTCDHGIDAEIEFKDRSGRATGKRIYLQLKSGDSYIFKRKRDGKVIFTVKNKRHLEYWQSQPCPVYLVHRASNGEISWMDVSRYLGERKNKDSLLIEFTGELFNSHSLTCLRDETLPENVAASHVVALASTNR